MSSATVGLVPPVVGRPLPPMPGGMEGRPALGMIRQPVFGDPNEANKKGSRPRADGVKRRIKKAPVSKGEAKDAPTGKPKSKPAKPSLSKDPAQKADPVSEMMGKPKKGVY